jgi:hypothetical protein
MTNTLLVLADVGHLKAYRFRRDTGGSTPKLELLENWETEVTHHLSEDFTDDAGRYRKGSVHAGPSNLSDGEQHNIDLERRRRALKGIAQHINELVRRESPEACYLAAGSEINSALVEELDPKTRSAITKNVTANLTRLNQDEVIRHFSE